MTLEHSENRPQSSTSRCCIFKLNNAVSVLSGISHLSELVWKCSRQWTDTRAVVSCRRREFFRFAGQLRGSSSNARTAAAPTDHQSAPPSAVASRPLLLFRHVGTNFEAIFRRTRQRLSFTNINHSKQPNDSIINIIRTGRDARYLPARFWQSRVQSSAGMKNDVHFNCHIKLSSDQLRAASLIGRNAVTWLWALSNDGRFTTIYHVRWKCRMIGFARWRFNLFECRVADVVCYIATCRTGLNERNSVRQIVDRSYK